MNYFLKQLIVILLMLLLAKYSTFIIGKLKLKISEKELLLTIFIIYLVFDFIW